MQDMEPATITVEQAAVVLGIGRQTAYELARQGKLPALRLGRRWVVPKVALDRMLAAPQFEESKEEE